MKAYFIFAIALTVAYIIYYAVMIVEKPLNFAPFGHAELSLLAKI